MPMATGCYRIPADIDAAWPQIPHLAHLQSMARCFTAFTVDLLPHQEISGFVEENLGFCTEDWCEKEPFYVLYSYYSYSWSPWEFSKAAVEISSNSFLAHLGLCWKEVLVCWTSGPLNFGLHKIHKDPLKWVTYLAFICFLYSERFCLQSEHFNPTSSTSRNLKVVPKPKWICFC